MSDKFLLNLLYILVALAFWLLPVLLRWLRRRKEAAAQERPHGPEPVPAVQEQAVFVPLVDPFDEHLPRFMALLGEIDEIEAGAREIKQACSGPGLARHSQLVDVAVTQPVEQVRRALQAGIDNPGTVDPYRLVAESSEAMSQVRDAFVFLARSVHERRQEGHARRNARGVALARMFLARIEGLLYRGAGTPSSPLFLPVEQPDLLPPGLLTVLAAAEAVPFDAAAGRSLSPRAWASIARDVARWAYRRTPDLEAEIEGHYALSLEALGYHASLPPEGLTREVFIHAVAGLFLGPVYARALESGAEGLGGEDIARRMHELAAEDELEGSPLPLAVEIVVRVLHGQSLEALSGSRLTDITALGFGRSDAARASAAAEAMLEDRVPDETPFHVVVGAMLASLDRPRATPGLVVAVDRALGIARPAAGRPAPRRRARAGRFVCPRAVREAIVVGALFER